MRVKEVKQELELGIRAWAETLEKLKEKPIDEFDRLRILETAFNRLFITVEHFFNALVLFETGNISKKHFGDYKKYQYIAEKYSLPNMPKIYEETYRLRTYADYRKTKELAPKFDKIILNEKTREVGEFITSCLTILKNKLDLKEIIKYYRKSKQILCRRRQEFPSQSSHNP